MKSKYISYATAVLIMILFLNSSVMLNAQDDLDTQDLEEKNMMVIREVIDLVWNNSEISETTMLEYYSIPHMFYGFERPIVDSATSFAEYLTFAGTVTWPDRKTTIQNLFATNDWVVAHLRISATFEGQMQGHIRSLIDPHFMQPVGLSRELPPSQELAEWDFVVMYRLEDSKIVEERWFWNHEFLSPHSP